MFSTLRLDTLPDEVLFARVPDMQAAAVPLLHMLYDSRTPAFSITCTEGEVSLVLTEQQAKNFPPQCLQMSSDRYRILRVVEGEELLGSSGLIAYICKPLVKKNIPIFYTSLYDSDYLIVETDLFLQSKEAIEELLAQETVASPQHTEPPPEEHRVLLDPLPRRVVTSSLSRQDFATHLAEFIRMLILEDPAQEGHFLSLTWGEERVSLIVEEEQFQRIQDANPSLFSTLTVYRETWVPVEVLNSASGSYDKHSVNGLSGPLGLQGVSIYYASTFAKDFVLMEAQDVARGLEVLSEKYAHLNGPIQLPSSPQ